MADTLVALLLVGYGFVIGFATFWLFLQLAYSLGIVEYKGRQHD